jgi:hypothetical protein
MAFINVESVIFLRLQVVLVFTLGLGIEVLHNIDWL